MQVKSQSIEQDTLFEKTNLSETQNVQKSNLIDSKMNITLDVNRFKTVQGIFKIVEFVRKSLAEFQNHYICE